jgi:hypothetical protein
MMKNIITKILLVTMGTLFSGCALIDFNTEIGEKMLSQSTQGRIDFEYLTIVWESSALYEQKKNTFTKDEWEKGPCLGRINDQWVVDIVHTPRIAVDDDMNNQCQEYYDNDQIKHYVLMKEDGGVFRSK